MIGILTYHFAHNYGAMLQAYALMSYYKNCGDNVEIINYIPKLMQKQYSIGVESLSIKNFWWKIFNNIKRRQQYELFENFRYQRLGNSDAIETKELQSYCMKFSTIITGSDQVWNTDINNNDSNYFLSFATSGVSKVGYSISIGSIKTDKENRALLDANMHEFERISFREKSTVDYYDELFHKRYPVTCDPVFLLNANEWRKIEKKPNSRLPKNYILYYSLSQDESLVNSIKEIAMKENLDIIAIHPLCKSAKFADLNLTNVGPEQFLWLIDNASYVASNSFHATAFSIIFKKRAVLKPHPVLGDRNRDLLKLVYLSDKTGAFIDFSSADTSKLSELIDFSKQYLTESSIISKFETTENENHAIVIGAKQKNYDKRVSSQSGGAATVISEYFIKQHAVVYGVGFNDGLDVVYHRITEIEELRKIKGSKYVRAYINNTFTNVLQDLKSGKKVLFIGHACVIAGLKKIVERNDFKDNLYTMDFVCHGTPSHELYREYLDWVEIRERKKIASFNFRYKDITNGGWRQSGEKIKFEDNSQIISTEYTDLFYANLGLRSCCSVCKFSSYKRISDFTVADYWGIENSDPDFADNAGVSLIMLNSQRSHEVFDYLNEQCDLIASDIQKCQQPNMIAPSPIPAYRSLYWKELKEHGFVRALKKFTRYGGLITKVRKRIYKYTGRWI